MLCSAFPKVAAAPRGICSARTLVADGYDMR